MGMDAATLDMDRLWAFREDNPAWHFAPWDKQIEAMQADFEIRLLAWANRTGKTTVGANECVLAGSGEHAFIGYPPPPFTIWACSVDYKQMRDSVIPAFEGDSTHPRMLPKGVTLNEQKMCYVLPSGTIVRLKSADSGRESFQGAAIPLIWIDEELPEEILKEIFVRIGPGFKRRILWTMTAVKGLTYPYRMFYLPWFKWKQDHPERPQHPRIYCSEAAMAEAPFLDKQEIADLDALFPPGSRELYVRKHGGFVDLAGDSIFSDEAITYHRGHCRAAAETVVLERVRGTTHELALRPAERFSSWQIAVWNRPDPAYGYVIGADVAEGRLSDKQDVESERDWSVAYVLNRFTRSFDAVCRTQTDPTTFGKILWMLGYWYGCAWIVPEVNPIGVAVLAVLIGQTDWPRYPRLYQRERHYEEWSTEITDLLGYKTTTLTRPRLISNLYNAVERDPASETYDLHVFDEGFVDEMKTFQKNKDGKPEAVAGFTDDRIMAAGLAIEGHLSCPPPGIVRIASRSGTPIHKPGVNHFVAGGCEIVRPRSRTVYAGRRI